ncbi:MAG TPA: hypothetical protein VEL28_00630 [Candidatus Binatia bacterium]|nr:hypothetical protein [Candidatus Binatia bacterium]
MILILGAVVAASVWVYEVFTFGLTTWQPIPFHQLLATIGMLPRDTYVWAYCSTKAGQARAAIEFCAEAPATSAGLGKAVWLYLGTEAGVVVACTAMVLSVLAMMLQGITFLPASATASHEKWPDQPSADSQDP